MNWNFAMLGVCLLVFQTDPPAAVPQVPAPQRAGGIAVDLGRVPMQGVWYQDGRDHAHDNAVSLKHLYRKNGMLTVDLGTNQPGGTDLAFIFSHDETGATHVSLTANFRHDPDTEGSPPSQRLRELEGRVVLPTNDWGPGKSLTCVFAVEGKLEKERQVLLGSFLVIIPK